MMHCTNWAAVPAQDEISTNREVVMNLFTSELFHPVMSPFQPRSSRLNAPAFGRRYGRAAERPAPAAPVRLTACSVERIEDRPALPAYDQAA
jgi:hypothetical protein